MWYSKGKGQVSTLQAGVGARISKLVNESDVYGPFWPCVSSLFKKEGCC